MFAGLVPGASAALTAGTGLFFGGPGDQEARGVLAYGSDVFLAGGGSSGPAILVKYATPPSSPVWAATIPGNAHLNDGMGAPGGLYMAGDALPPACGASDGVGGTEHKSMVARFTTSGALVSCSSPNHFPYRGGEGFNGLAVAPDGTVYVAGAGENCGFGHYLMVLAKYDANLVPLAKVTEVGSAFTGGGCIGGSHLTNLVYDGGALYVVGASRLTGRGEDNTGRAVIMKYDTALNRVWRYRDPNAVASEFRDLAILDGRIYAVGFANTHDFHLSAFDLSGTLLYRRVWSAGGEDVLNGITTANGRLYATGYVGAATHDVVMFEIDPATGNVLDTVNFGGAQAEHAQDVVSVGGSLYVGGETRSFAVAGNALGQSDMFLLPVAAGSGIRAGSPVFFGGVGEDQGKGLGTSGADVLIAGDGNPGEGMWARYGVSLGTPIWSAGVGGNYVVNDVAATGAGVYSAGGALPPNCGAADFVGGTEHKSALFRHATPTGSFVNCVSANWFPYRGGEGWSTLVPVTSGGVTHLYTGGGAENCGFGHSLMVLAKYTESLALVRAVTEPGSALGASGGCIGYSSINGMREVDGFLYAVGHSALTGRGEDGTGRGTLAKYDTNLNRLWRVRTNDGALGGVYTDVARLGDRLYVSGYTPASPHRFLVDVFDLSGVRLAHHVWGTGSTEVLTTIDAVGSRLFVGGVTNTGTGEDAIVMEINPATGAVVGTVRFGGAQQDWVKDSVVVGSQLFVGGFTRSFAVNGNLVGQSEMFVLPILFGGTDTTPPVIPPLADVTAEATGPGGATVTFAVPMANDAVDGPVAMTCGPASGSFFPIATTTVGCTARDAAGNSATGTFRVTVRDTRAPTLTVPGSIVAEATGPSGAVVTYATSAFDVVDGPRPVSCSRPSGSTFPIGTLTVSCSASDTRGNAVLGSFPVTVADTTAPTISVPPEIQVEASGPSGSIVEFAPTASDAVAGSTAVSCSPAPGSLFPLGETTVSCSSSDGTNTGLATFLVRVVDTTSPALAIPTEVVAEAAGPDGALVSYEASADDMVDGPLPVTCGPASGALFALGETVVACAASDGAGNGVTGSFPVRVVDTTAPTLTLPGFLVIEAEGPAGAVAIYAATASDLVDGSVPITCSAGSGATFPLGVTTVECSAADARGNVGTGTFTVAVMDTTAPALTLPGTLTVEATSAAGATVAFTATAEDLVSGAVAVLCAPASGETFPLGSTTVSCMAQDAAGNLGSGTFLVNVVDTTPPTLTMPGEVVAEATGPAGAEVAFDIVAMDLVDGAVAAACAPTSGATFPLGATSVDCSATDAAGNTVSASFLVRVVDTTAPALALPGFVSAEAAGPDGASVTYDATATDLVDGPVSATCAPSSGGTFGLGATEVTCTAGDAAGNAAVGTFTVEVVDTTAPALEVPADVVAEATGPDGAAVAFAASATDLVDGAVAAACAPASGATFPLGATGVACTATDAAGNAAAGSFTVTVVDTTAPETILYAATDGDGETLGATGGTLSDTATFAFGGHDAVGVAEQLCSLDGGAATPCTSPWTVGGLAEGDHTVAIHTVDAAGNADATPVVVSWTRNTPAEEVGELLAMIPSSESGMRGPLGEAEAILTDANERNDGAACGKLNAFENQVNAARRAGRITAALAAELLDGSGDLEGALGC